MTAHYHDLAETATSLDGPHYVTGDRSQRSDAGQSGLYRNGVKRALDVVIVMLFLPVVLPVILLLALIVATDGKRALYSQQRVGRNGRMYTMWKLRTMVVDAESKLQAYIAQNPDARREWESTQKLKNDPRITRFGRILRKTSFDELPQLWNVLTGDMSLVGPRPMMPEQKVLYPGHAYYELRPGITGLWQISDRNESSFAAGRSSTTATMKICRLPPIWAFFWERSGSCCAAPATETSENGLTGVGPPGSAPFLSDLCLKSLQCEHPRILR